MDDRLYKEIKYLTSLMYSTAHQLFGNEFAKVYRAPPSEFCAWMNKVTGLDLDHRLDKLNSIRKWLDALETIRRERNHK
jgi:hypothetical protein